MGNSLTPYAPCSLASENRRRIQLGFPAFVATLRFDERLWQGEKCIQGHSPGPRGSPSTHLPWTKIAFPKQDGSALQKIPSIPSASQNSPWPLQLPVKKARL
mmetsp:Transcript_45208/g.94670  ORF Transcript_45208/g.94670 Transcript_45208/m.94670 type:complete len:102 (-) Transcript_45208:442-747(-)